MMPRVAEMRLASGLLLLLLVGCASQRSAPESAANTYNVDRRMLQQETAQGGAASAHYSLSATQGFRMPQALHAPSPQMPDNYQQQSLPPTTLCVRVIVDAQGAVTRSEPLLTQSGCAAGSEADNAGLMQAALAATAQWRFRPAAQCSYVEGVARTGSDDCQGAEQVENVPVTLAYAFTFEVVEGKVVVRSRDGLR